jgi:enoyl-CoA hydratase/carnithine racemase
MSDASLVLVDIDRGVATLTFNRPESNNGWTGGLEQAYYNALEDCEADPDVKVIVVTGAGRSFCPGADMNMLAAGASSGGNLTSPEPLVDSGSARPAEQAVGRTKQPLVYPAIHTKPLIGAINGACAGVGLVQALMFDLRFAAAGAKFTVAFARRGLIAEYGSAWLLPRIVGQANALDLLLSSRVVLAEEALQMGLVNRVFPKEELLAATQAYARDLAVNCSPTSMAVMKSQVSRAWEMDLPTAMDEAYGLMNRSLRLPDFKEGVTSFIAKREPSFGPIQSDLVP